ncbi:hypothetical protein [Pseudoxanthomonas sp. JBR18]|uniref:hypothetical protein n=1 Tax=Pseudoxanthomonas sp. JBR18 TaxID=2969308 RepID=UPI002306A977|nr:hypothetical protein [Pseudoxanthomonas sp. JBR18]WCE05087.1 hypothetical protein PJ250_03655 [Pseudoxanthomonas sp. JBR18]
MLRSLALVSALSLAAFAAPSYARTTCHLDFKMSGWSAFYKTSEGTGRVTCDDGESMPVKVSAKGGGLTVGKSTIEGTGEFTEVRNLNEVLGSYATAEAHAGAEKSSKAQVMTKGEVSLSLAGTGKGWDVGIAFGAFHIDPM